MWETRDIRRLVMVGACYVDTILSVPCFPQEDHKLRASSLERRRGGNVANSLEVLQQLFDGEEDCPVELVLLCVLPAKDSPGTKLVQASLGHVNMTHCIYREGHDEPASSYIIRAIDTGSRTIVNCNDLPEMTFAEFKQQVEAMDDAKTTWFHFEGREVETSLACMDWLRHKYPDVTLSAEIEKPNREGLDRMAAAADVVFFSKTWAEARDFESAGDLLEAQAECLPQASLLFCTWGAEGADVCGPDWDTICHAKWTNDPTDVVVDTIGAGDTFVAGVLWQMLISSCPSSEFSLDEHDRGCQAANFATKLATRKVFQHGFGNMVELGSM
ncbi:hypothetical protein DOTSEDRAFT_70601 [Dothistroma septosporum NZE10]|uniref:Carbohydrate kinase PfkB domain-containing protein n=1 Tax=Dothistroma septosporum (strain NZE10 / CBS 128990) TaxID=675120 RepID=N1PWR7_DOTSN|nr:hypothetical protein DOTSEDRAFT_70601 [Dothistroma septosporum NZE10]